MRESSDVAAAPHAAATVAAKKYKKLIRAVGSHKSSTETVIMTPAAKERLKDIVQSLGVDGRTRTSAPPSAVALPATAAFKTGCQRLIEGMCLGWALLAGVEIIRRG